MPGFRKRPRGQFTLSARLLVLTVGFVMLSEVLIYAPSIARFRVDWLRAHIATAHLATLALEATPDNMVSEDLKNELLKHAGAYAIVIQRPGDVRRVLSREMPPKADETCDLRSTMMVDLVVDSFMVLFETHNRVLRVLGPSPKDENVLVEVLLDEMPMRMAMIDFSWRILALSLLISFFTASLVYLTLQWLMVRPLRRLSASMVAFRDAPEDSARMIVPSDRRDEIGVAERELAQMEEAVRAALRQRARLAALGEAVAKINHDLRNILASGRLVSDRLADSADPHVKRVAQTLVETIDRAVALCSQTLNYARDDPPPPSRTRFSLRDCVDDAGRVVALLTEGRAQWDNRTLVGLDIEADREQIFRVLVNLGRNASEAGAKQVRVAADSAGGADLVLDIADDGPGLPPKARDKLFQPFAGSTRSGGTGLGLAIARDLVRGHGGDLMLVESSPAGTVFRINLPRAVTSRSHAAE
ncbi:MAG: HAMP domain-containing histidine kinase [Proteobacteria bacterium]|nr:HAMP domain-containing histidine kinase [Pseudomonadota bacterium]